jgi:tRNA-2-methylthio-N6-dimethylallyladenosine synthase
MGQDLDQDGAAAKRVYVKTYGCQMNVYDSARMEELLAAEGYVATARAQDADLIVMNTCHIREKAVDKVYSEIGKFRVMKDARARKGLGTRIAITGCVAQAEGEELTRREAAIDLVLGPQTYHRLPQLLKQRETSQRAIVETAFPAEDKFDGLGMVIERRPLTNSVSAFLTVQEGCDKFCTFCVVPYTRGAEFSRPVQQVVKEAAELARTGVREVTLLGQNVNAYHGAHGSGTASLAQLVAELSKMDGIERIRYTTSHPRNMGDDLIDAHARNPKLMPYLHLPVQAGSDRVLKAMNRGHTASDYVKLIARIRAARPDIAISGDFIVGFPGETETDFEATLAMVREIRYASAYSFKYSARPGTPAAEHDAQVPEEIKADRLQQLQALLTAQLTAFNLSCVGQSLPVLVEKPGRHAGQVIGRSPYLQSVHFDAEGAQIGDIVNVDVLATKTNSLEGRYKRVAA